MSVDLELKARLPQSKRPKATGDLQKLSVRAVMELYDPFRAWGTRVSEEKVRSLVLTGPYKTVPGDYQGPLTNATRIAYLIRYGWEDPIEVDVGIPVYVGGYGSVRKLTITDGNHRLCAAVVAGDRYIVASCGGSVDEIDRLTYGKKAR